MTIVLQHDKGPVHHQVATYIRHIITKEYTQGDFLPPHRILAKQVGVGLRSITNAIQLLAEQGIVTPVPGKGTRIARIPSAKEERLSRIALVAKTDYGKLFTGHNGQILSGMSDFLDELNIELLLLPRQQNGYTPVKKIISSGVDGIALLGIMDEKYINEVAKYNIPIVLVRNHPANMKMDSVICDNFGTTAKIFDYLVEKGHKNITYATFEVSNQSDSDNIERHESFMLEMKCHDLELTNPICELNKSGTNSPQSPESIINLIKTEKNPPTAIIADSEETAHKLLQIFNNADIKVPDDISIAVIAMLQNISGHTETIFTGCFINFLEMGSRAIDLIIEQCQDNRYAPRVIRVGYKFSEGKTVKNII